MNNKAFTLIELLVVISIIGVISSIVFVSFSGSRDKARLAKAQNFDAQISHALGAYAVGIWRFEEGSGTTAHDESGYGNDGTLGNGACTPGNGSCPSWAIGQGVYSGTNALTFDGNDDYVNTGLTIGDLGTNYSIGAWFKYTGTAGRTYSAIIGGNEATTEFFLGKNNGNINIGWQNGNYISNMGSGTNAFNGNWHYITITMAGITGKLYLDGKLLNTQTFTGCNITEGIFIGLESEGGGYYWDGSIDNVRIYNEALSSAQIQQHYAAGAPSHGIAVNQ